MFASTSMKNRYKVYVGQALPDSYRVGKAHACPPTLS